MKVLAFVEYDYDYSVITGGVIIPDDFNEQEAMIQWREETFAPAKWKNQHGEGFTKSKQNPTVPFAKWLREKYEEVEVVECGW